jgi:DNA-binding MarR family transcriptional regulator
MSTFDPSKLQIDRSQVEQSAYHPIAERKVSTNRKQEHFLKGPVPLPWLIKASKCSGKALAVAIAIRYRSGLCKTNQITLTSRVLEKFGIDRSAKSRAIQCLEEAGLISVERQHGKNPVITILEIGKEP